MKQIYLVQLYINTLLGLLTILYRNCCKKCTKLKQAAAKIVATNECIFGNILFIFSHIARNETNYISQPSSLNNPSSMMHNLFSLSFRYTHNKEYNGLIYYMLSYLIYKLWIFRLNIDNGLLDKDGKLMKRLLEYSSYQVFFARANAVLQENGFLTWKTIIVHPCN